MAQSYLIFDFGTQEEVAQQAHHKLDGWKRGFRLGEKLAWKFERVEPEKKDGPEKVRIVVRLDFSDHEKLSHQRWLDRLPSEEPFKSAAPQVVRAGDAKHSDTEELYESLATARPTVSGSR